MKSKRPIVMGGVEYPSCYAAAKVLGISRKTLEYRMEKGLPFEGTRTTHRRVIVNGVLYPSIRAAARAQGCLPGAVHYRLRKHGVIMERIDYTPRAKPIKIDGTLYPSRAAAARALGISYAKLSKVYK